MCNSFVDEALSFFAVDDMVEWGLGDKDNKPSLSKDCNKVEESLFCDACETGVLCLTCIVWE